MIRSQVDPRIVEPPGGLSIVAIAAHPDDIERWCAGTLPARSKPVAPVEGTEGRS